MAAVSVRYMHIGSYAHFIALLLGVGNVKFLVYNIYTNLPCCLPCSLLLWWGEAWRWFEPHCLVVAVPTTCKRQLACTNENLCYVHSLHITCMQKNPRIYFQYIFKFLNELLAAWRLPGHSSYKQIAWDHKLPWLGNWIRSMAQGLGLVSVWVCSHFSFWKKFTFPHWCSLLPRHHGGSGARLTLV